MTEALIGVIAAFILIFARVPLAVALGLVGFVGFGLLISWKPAFAMVALTAKSSLLNYYLSVIPLFVLMGNFLTRAGISRELYAAAYAVMGHLCGGPFRRRTGRSGSARRGRCSWCGCGSG